MTLVLAALLALAVLVWALRSAPLVDESNCPIPLLLENGRCPSPCRLPPPCTESKSEDLTP